jgi:hypothetical protein
LPSSTTGAVPATHAPELQVSAPLQAVASAQDVQSGLAGFEQTPVVVLQVPALWQTSEATQTTGFAPVQEPDWHASAWVQALPSLQELPFAFSGFEHAPVLGLHVPALWH